MNSLKIKAASLLLALCLSSIVLAESYHSHESPLETSPNLSLHEVVEKTYQRNPQIEVMQARLNHVNALSQSAQSLLPSDPSFSVSHFNDLIIDHDGLQEWEVGMDLPLWLPGQKAARQKSVEQQRSLVNASEPALKLQLAGIVREIVWNIALRKNQMAVAKQEWEVVKKLERDVNKRVKLGDLARSDLILTQQESLSKEAIWRKARQEYRHAQHRYDMITGLDVLPADFKETISGDLSINIDHPALKEAHEKVSQSTAQRDQVILEKRGNPSLFVGSRHERGNSDEEFADAFGLSFSMPFGLAAHTTPKVTAAEVDLTENRSQMEILHRQLNIAIQDASRELTATKEQYDFSQRQNELSKQNLAMSRKAFSLGESSLIELIRIQAQAFAVERDMHQKQLEVGLHTARLNQAKGIIP